MSVIVNPTTLSITDTSAASQGVVDFKLLLGTTTGGPYNVSSATVNVSAMTNNSGVYTCPFSSLTFSPALQSFTNYFAVAEAQNGQGVSGGSPEASFQIETAPSAPTALGFA